MKQPGLDDRHRDTDGQIRRKNGNTLVRTQREDYGPGFAEGYRSDAHLSTVLRKEGAGNPNTASSKSTATRDGAPPARRCSW